MRGSWRPNRTAIYWPPLLWPSALYLSRSPDAQPEARGLSFLLSAGFHFHILSPTGLVSKTHWESRGPLLPGGGFLYHILSPTSLLSNSIGGPEGPFCWVVAFSTTSCLQLLRSPTNWLLVFTELYNSSIAHSISILMASQVGICHFQRLWTGMFDHHQAEITVMQFRGHSLPVHQSMSVSWDFTLSHFVSQARLRDFFT